MQGISSLSWSSSDPEEQLRGARPSSPETSARHTYPPCSNESSCEQMQQNATNFDKVYRLVNSVPTVSLFPLCRLAGFRAQHCTASAQMQLLRLRWRKIQAFPAPNRAETQRSPRTASSWWPSNTGVCSKRSEASLHFPIKRENEIPSCYKLLGHFFFGKPYRSSSAEANVLGQQ